MRTKHKKDKQKVQKVVLAIILILFFAQRWHWVWSNFDLYFQSPIVLERQIISPIPKVIKAIDVKPIPTLTIAPVKRLSPTPTTKITPKVKKVTVDPFKKFLTDKGTQTRTKVLAILSKFYSGDNLIAFDNILKKESGYRYDAVNEIGAGGICQAYPASKMNCPLDESGLECQVTWCKTYIDRRYGTPVEAWNFHLNNNWF